MLAGLPGKARFFIYGVIAVGLPFLAFVLGRHLAAGEPVAWPTLLFFLGLMVTGDLLSIDLPRGGSVAITSTFYIGAIVLLGTGPAVALAVLADVLARGCGLLRLPWYRTFFNVAQLAISVGLAGVAYQALGPGSADGLSGLAAGPLLGEFLRVVLAAAVLLGLNCFLVTIALSLAQGLGLKDILETNVGWLLPNMLALAALGLVVGEIYRVTGYLGLLLLWGPLLVARHSFRMYLDLHQLYLETVQALARAIEAKDATTYGHSERVSLYAAAAARRLGWGEKAVENLAFTAVLHDTGKLGIPEAILNKPDRLDNGEFEWMKRHSEVGARIIAEIDGLRQGEEVVRHHHERWDGRGYPFGLQGEEIPLGARIISVADAFDAITSDRPYRRGATAESALAELRGCAGSQFDPRVVEAFVEVYSSGELQDILRGDSGAVPARSTRVTQVVGAAREAAATVETGVRSGGL